MLSGFTSYALFTDTVISDNVITLKTGKKTKTFTYTGDCEEYTVPYTGYYQLEAWGAQGGYSLCDGSKCSSEPGKGGYTSGITKLLKGETLYVCVGGKGSDGALQVNSAGGYNGGGLGTWDTTDDETSGGGGGSTDIRLVSGSWDTATGLNSRIMVASGGGGASWIFDGGSGGGLIGETTFSSNSVGTQTSGYAFGKGQNASGVGQSDGVGGGGSGYYGGYAPDVANQSSGTGGSSFISGYAGVNAITSSTDRTHTNNTLHYSGKYFINAKMEAGTNSGNGKAKITYVSSLKPERVNTSLNNVRYIKDCINGSNRSTSNHWGEVQVIYNGVNVALGKEVTSTGTINDEYGTGLITSIVDGNILSDNFARFDGDNQCVTIDLGQTYDLDEVAVWHRWDLDYTYNDNYTYVSSDNTNWTIVIDKQEAETSEGKRVNAYEKPNKSYIFTYTGECEEYTVEKTGYYKIEAYGAQGGGTTGGKGAYTSGIVSLIKGETLYICVGGQGGNNTAGYNGGGTGQYIAGSASTSGYGGGGATDIRLSSGTWDNTTSLNSRIMVASGGGGRSEYGYAGAVGGALLGNSGTGECYTATGGTQTSGGSAGDTDATAGSFGKGGSCPNGSTTSGTYGSGAGGSGYYGGGGSSFRSGSSCGSSGASGSSFISGYAGVNAITSSTDRTHSNNTLHYSGKYFINTEMESGVRSGNGKAVITYISEERPERTNTSLNNVRYIKDCINGNSETTSNHWLELQAIYNGTNVALSKTVTSTGTINDEYGTGLITSIVDGNILSDNFARFNSGNQCVTVDLGQTYDLDEVAVWHYWATGRTYNDNYTYVSSDNSTWVKVIDKQEPETSQGKRVNAYEGTSLTIKQNTGGTLTCKNNTTNQTSTSSLSVTKGDSITCSVSVSSGYKSTSIKIGNDSITSESSFTYDYDTSTTIIPKYYKYCSSTTSKTIWNDSCSAYCGGGTKYGTKYYYDATYTSYSCGSETVSTSCNTQSCTGCYKVSIYDNYTLNCRSGRGTEYALVTYFYPDQYVMFTYDSSGWYYSPTYGCYSYYEYFYYVGQTCP